MTLPGFFGGCMGYGEIPHTLWTNIALYLKKKERKYYFSIIKEQREKEKW
jgi:hypothetical protein